MTKTKRKKWMIHYMWKMSLIVLLGIPLIVAACSSPKTTEPPKTLPEPQPWVWQQVADFGGPSSRGAMAFAFDSAAYVVSGAGTDSLPHRQVWKYDFGTNVWSRKNDYPGTPVIEGVGFSINQKGYICVGSPNTTAPLVADLWEYDPASDQWTQKANYPGSPRSGSTVLVIGQKAYVLAGSAGASGSPIDVWEYDPQGDRWTRKADFPGGGRFLPAGFVVGDKGYVGTGTIAGTGFTVTNDLWEYNPQTDRWTRKADFPGAARSYAIGLTLGNKGYLIFGLLDINSTGTSLTLSRDLWEYDVAGDSWTQKTDFSGQARVMTVGFVLGSYLYVGPGNNASVQNLIDVWRIRVPTTTR